MPTHPELTRLLRDHLAKFGTASGRPPVRRRPGRRTADDHLPARLDQSAPDGSDARQSKPHRSPGGPYDLRHACLSTWLNGGVYPTQVAEWAGHGVDVLLRIYAKCVVGQDELAKRRISEALRQD